MRPAAIYLRVSTQKQARDDRWGYERQITEATTYARARDLDVVATYKDAITGTTATRVGLQNLLDHQRQHPVVIIPAIDRLSRDMGAGYAIAQSMHEHGLEVHSADMGHVNFTDESSMLHFGILNAVAHADRMRITKRTQAAQVAMAEAGRLPNGIRTYGYHAVGDGTAEIIPEQARVIRRIYEAAARRESLSSIAKALNAERVPIARPNRARRGGGHWSRSRLSRLIKNTTYRGLHPWSLKGRTYQIPVPPIVTPELWAAAQSPKRGAPARSGWPLVGISRCARCGSRLSAKTRVSTRKSGRKVKYEYYRCQGKTSPWRRCDLPYQPRTALETATSQRVHELLSVPGALAALLERDTPTPPDPRAEQLREESSALLLAYRRNVITLDELETARREVAEQLTALERPAPPTVDVTGLLEFARSRPWREFIEHAGLVVVVDHDLVRLDATS